VLSSASLHCINWRSIKSCRYQHGTVKFPLNSRTAVRSWWWVHYSEKGKLRESNTTRRRIAYVPPQEHLLALTTKYGTDIFQDSSQGVHEKDFTCKKWVAAPYISDSITLSIHTPQRGHFNLRFIVPDTLPTLHRKCQETLWCLLAIIKNWNMCDLRLDAFQNIGVNKSIEQKKRNHDWKSNLWTIPDAYEFVTQILPLYSFSKKYYKFLREQESGKQVISSRLRPLEVPFRL